MTLVAARDPRGLEPLIVLRRHDLLAVASDLPTMLASGIVDRRIDWPALRAYLRTGFVPEPATLVAGLTVLPAGSCLVAAREGVRLVSLGDASAEAQDTAAVLRERVSAGKAAIVGTKSAGCGVRKLERLLNGAGCSIPVYTIAGNGATSGIHRRVPLPRSEEAILELLGRAFALPGQPSIAAVEARLLSDAAIADGAELLLSGAGGCAGTDPPSGAFARLVDGLYARRPAVRVVFTDPELLDLIGEYPHGRDVPAPPPVVPDRLAGHRARFRPEQEAGRDGGAEVSAPLMELATPERDGRLAAIETALPIAPLLEGSLRTVAREFILGLAQDSILLGAASRDLWRAAGTMPNSVDSAKIWSLVALGAWTRRHRITA